MASLQPNQHLFWSSASGEWLKQQMIRDLQIERDDLAGKLQNILADRDQYHIYLSIVRDLCHHFHKYTEERRLTSLKFGEASSDIPFIIGVAGGVAAGKTTAAAVFRELLSQLLGTTCVDVVSTDNFLFPNAVLEEKGITERKGFPESYDMAALIQFLQHAKTGQPDLTVPVYSHDTYDVSSTDKQLIHNPRIILLEGINVLQRPHRNGPNDQFISDYLDFAIYVDAEEDSAINWYLERVEKLYTVHRDDPASYFHRFSGLTIQEFRERALQIWHTINGPNLRGHIAPTKERANIILKKDANHNIEEIFMRKF
ncbi:pantothenate kinase [Scopulibacillus darangshiensis]|uniref:Pantothenate kinase n=1 Tax=Scopulibacillus darangshiensis TaxID=442528 RepID=A0A4R2PBT0_9BACL|nr:type I pantothenate kinase [Scopulibacillus darangshiensis]TCP31774.1 pantothenate kinase [Scopulibacillus darangshiensis]